MDGVIDRRQAAKRFYDGCGLALGIVRNEEAHPMIDCPIYNAGYAYGRQFKLQFHDAMNACIKAHGHEPFGILRAMEQ